MDRTIYHQAIFCPEVKVIVQIQFKVCWQIGSLASPEYENTGAGLTSPSRDRTFSHSTSFEEEGERKAQSLSESKVAES